MTNSTGRYEVRLKQNDTAPAFASVLHDAVGEAVNLAGASARMLMRHSMSREVKIDAPCVIPDQAILANRGRVTYQWVAQDTDEAGVFDLEVEVTYGDNSVETFPNTGYLRCRIADDIA